MAGPIARIVTQLVLAGGSVFIKAFSQAYQQAAAQGPQKVAKAAVRRGAMAVSQAKSILQLEESELTRAAIMEAFQRHFDKNDPEQGGSYYLQCKVFHAREALLAELPDEDDSEDEEEQGPAKEIEDGQAGAAHTQNNR
ncbi:pam16 [Symbiodinium sp. KB8]|nr:pam16 [Symbiodinium sp. KB8]